MQFYRNSTGGPSYLVLHKNEWNKLKKKAAPPTAPVKRENVHLKTLIDQSQAWIRTWPDTVQGHVAQVVKHKEEQRLNEITTVKVFVAKKARDSTNVAIKNARERIFNESCYGNKLLAAFRESKTLEERDVQIEYLKKIRKETAELEEKKAKQELQHCSFGLDKNDVIVKHANRQKAVEVAQINKDTYQKHKEDIEKTKRQHKIEELEEAGLMKELLEREKEAHAKVALHEKQIMAEYGAEQKKIKAAQAERNAKYDKAVEESDKELTEYRFKIQNALKQVQNKRLYSTKSKKIYDILEKCQQEEKNRYDKFITKQAREMEDRILKSDENGQALLDKKREKVQSIVETNKLLAETARQLQCASNNKCYCDRQCVLPNSHKEHMKKIKSEIKTEENRDKQTHFGQCSKLTASLRRREKEPSPYTGAGAAHKQFAKEADDTLRDCKYKMAGRRVVDEYRRYNGLDATTLPIPNYY